MLSLLYLFLVHDLLRAITCTLCTLSHPQHKYSHSLHCGCTIKRIYDRLPINRKKRPKEKRRRKKMSAAVKFHLTNETNFFRCSFTPPFSVWENLLFFRPRLGLLVSVIVGAEKMSSSDYRWSESCYFLR